MRSKYRCKDTEKLLKHIWHLACHFETKKEIELSQYFKDEYFKKLREYQEKRKELADNYIFKGVS